MMPGGRVDKASAVVPHTPAPWKVFKGAADDETRWLVVYDGPRPWHIATVENGAPGDCLETEGATAHVLAAAPELLAALKECVNDCLMSLSPDVLALAEAAIAKAEDRK